MPPQREPILNSFLDTEAGGVRSASNFKAILSTGSKALSGGYIQKIEVMPSGVLVFNQSRCESEMKSSKPYQLKICVEVVGRGSHFKSAWLACSTSSCPTRGEMKFKN